MLEGAKNVIKCKKELKSSTPHIVFQFLVVKPNEHQIPDLMRLAKEIGANEVGLKTAQIYDYENGSELIPTIDKYSRYRLGKDGKYHIKNNFGKPLLETMAFLRHHLGRGCGALLF